MEINLQTKVTELLGAYPQLEEQLLKLSPTFAKLKNPILRRTVAKVTSLQQAAKIAGISPAQMVQALRKAVGLSSGEMMKMEELLNENMDITPGWFDESKITIRYDACPMIDMGASPMAEIIRLSKVLKEGEIMELTAPFEPVPIMEQLKSKGFEIWYNGSKCYFIKNG
ncbi:DUF1858 domain-containing protein [uncultured Bacteroides sp.]|uniref:DUF1858 domain-containing protein n=1 Tax=uncultured Bacteroides sp. TaxID=162156 RepID=UPI002596002B|nr:DUF1858 domain-containing protein [uncultured Bacteroides sp.]